MITHNMIVQLAHYNAIWDAFGRLAAALTFLGAVALCASFVFIYDSCCSTTLGKVVLVISLIVIVSCGVFMVGNTYSRKSISEQIDIASHYKVVEKRPAMYQKKIDTLNHKYITVYGAKQALLINNGGK